MTRISELFRKWLPINEFPKGEFIYEMATTIYKRQSGLPFNIWVSEKKYASGKHNRPRLKVLEPDYKASVAIDDPIEILANDGRLPSGSLPLLVKYIELNRESLMRLWNEEIDAAQYMSMQQSI